MQYEQKLDSQSFADGKEKKELVCCVMGVLKRNVDIEKDGTKKNQRK